MSTGVLSTSGLFELSGNASPSLGLVYGLLIVLLLFQLFSPSNVSVAFYSSNSPRNYGLDATHHN